MQKEKCRGGGQTIRSLEDRDTLKYYRLTLEQFYTPFYGNTMKHDCLSHKLMALHFSDNMKQPDKNNNYDKLWKITILSLSL
jgi:hypothetical protein